MPWYDGPTLLEHLETVETRPTATSTTGASRSVGDPPDGGEHHDYRGYAGQVAGGVWRAGDEVVVLPSGLRSRVAAVETADGPLDAAVPPMSVTIRLEDDVDVSRGDMLADPERPPIVARELTRARLLDERAAARAAREAAASSRRRAPCARSSTSSSPSSTSRRSRTRRRPSGSS